ncbi:peptidoglycan-binding protein [Micromonospora sp. NPDC048170]|uniref:peptidoglycan-binding protein n=1 Tax=Micromonospora sp. NPDC048170 TaxID=3154819 RepID=UPI0033E269A2
MLLGNRRRILVGVVVASVLCAAVGMSASVWVKSPQQVAAEAVPPPKTELTVPVERRVLRQTVILRGDVAAAQSLEVSPAPKAGSLAVVTGVKSKAGDEIDSGELLLEVSGRPLFVLRGTKPAYRDLRPGYEGPDVRQLQAALKVLGFGPKETDGYFGEGTKRAVERFYDSIGYPVIPTGPEDTQQLGAAWRHVVTAQRAVQDAADRVTRERAAEDLQTAKDDYKALLDRTGPTVPVSEYVFLPSFPSRVESLNAVVGGEVKGPLIKLSSGRLLVKAQLNPANYGTVKPGMAVEIVSEALGITAKGKVKSLGDLEINNKNGISAHPMVIVPNEPLSGKLAGQDVRLTVSAAATPGPVLVVPVSAIFARTDGTSKVIRVEGEGRKEELTVSPGMMGDGYVEIKGSLAAGDLVIVGALPQ